MYYQSSFSCVKHGFFTRQGGVSQPPFDTLNFALKPEESLCNVQINGQKVLESLGCTEKKLVTLNQVHSNEVIVVRNPWDIGDENQPAADAMITQNSDVVLGVITADCVPILLHDAVKDMVAVIHAGWRGLASGVVRETIAQMVRLGSSPGDIAAAVGPCIHQDNYEVGEEVYSSFASFLGKDNQDLRPAAQNNRYYLNLPSIAIGLLNNLGVSAVDWLRQDTYTQPEVFFSCRRAQHNNEPGFGCQISVISL